MTPTLKSKHDKIYGLIDAGQHLKLVHGQGKDWMDVLILRHNGIVVHEIENYDSLFKMVAAGRFDLFCRGASEVLQEYSRFKNLPGFALDHHFAFQYESPIFYYANKNNQRAIARVYLGLNRAFEDGSAMKMFQARFQESLKFVDLNNRKIFKLENPFVSTAKQEYKKYDILTTEKLGQ